MEIKKHQEWIDIAKGVAILLVVIGHSFPDAAVRGGVRIESLQTFREVIYLFHIPLMFFISGMLSKRIFRHAEHNDRWHYIYDRFKRLMIPYFCVGILGLLLPILISKYVVRPIPVFKRYLLGDYK